MSGQSKSHLTSADRDRIIRKIVNNPNMSKTAINQEAGIYSGRSGWREDRLLKPWIVENICLVFGEKITLQDLSLTNCRDNTYNPRYFRYR